MSEHVHRWALAPARNAGGPPGPLACITATIDGDVIHEGCGVLWPGVALPSLLNGSHSAMQYRSNTAARHARNRDAHYRPAA
jgi:hypothetical protein